MQFIVQSTSPDTAHKAVVYENANYLGRSQELPVGRYNLNQLTIGNDIISSIRIPAGVMVTLYEHADFLGSSKIFTEDTSYVGDAFNDKASSIIVQLAATVYEHANYQGSKQTIPVGNYNLANLTFGGDKISSLKVPPGLVVTLYEHPDYKGRGKSFMGDATYVGDDFNDITSSIVITRAEVIIPEGAIKYGDTIVLKSYHGKYMSAQPTGTLLADRDAIGIWERFTIQRSGNSKNKAFVSFGDTISLRSYHSKYVVAESNGTANANRDAVGQYEKFILVRSGRTKNQTFLTSGDIISLRSWQNKYMVAESTGVVNANRDAIGTWEQFTLMSGDYTATIFQGGDYQGASQVLPLGRYNDIQLTIGNDQLSSLKVAPGVVVMLHEAADFKGRTKTFTQDTSYVGNDFNDITSSITVQLAKSCAIVYADSNYGGLSQALPVGKYLASQLSIGNDTLSSLKIPNGMEITLYENDNFQGNSKKFTADSTYVGDDFNNKTSSIVVELSQPEEDGGSPCGGNVCAADVGGLSACGGAACAAAACGAAACGADLCAAAACGVDVCGAAASGVAICAAAAAIMGGCGAAACGADASGAGVCGAAACAAAACGSAACGADACAAAACGAAVCGAAACGGAACGADVAGVGACGGDACSVEGSGIEACPADACAANVCGINACPCDACAADVCGIDIIPIIPFI